MWYTDIILKLNFKRKQNEKQFDKEKRDLEEINQQIEEELTTTKQNFKEEIESITKSRACSLFKLCDGKGNVKNGNSHYVIYNCPIYNEVIYKKSKSRLNKWNFNF